MVLNERSRRVDARRGAHHLLAPRTSIALHRKKKLSVHQVRYLHDAATVLAQPCMRRPASDRVVGDLHGCSACAEQPKEARSQSIYRFFRRIIAVL